MITKQVEDIAISLLLSVPLRDPRELSIMLAAELTQLKVVDSDESARIIDLSTLISSFFEGFAGPFLLDVTISGEIRQFFINEGRAEALFHNILRSAHRCGARKVEIRCQETLERWFFSVEDDGDSLSSTERLASLECAYELSAGGDLRVGDVSLFVVKRVIEFYEGDISILPAQGGGSEMTFSIPKE